MGQADSIREERNRSIRRLTQRAKSIDDGAGTGFFEQKLRRAGVPGNEAVAKEPNKVQGDARRRVGAGEHDERNLRESPNYCNQQEQRDHSNRRLFLCPRDVLEAVIPDRAGH